MKCIYFGCKKIDIKIIFDALLIQTGFILVFKVDDYGVITEKR